MTSAAIADFIDHCNYLGLEDKTISTYRWALSKLAEHHAVLPRTPRPVQAVITFAELAEASKLTLWRSLRRFYSYTHNTRNHPDVMETIPPPGGAGPGRRRRRKLPRTLEASEVEDLLRAKHSRRDLAMLHVLLDTGIRVGELATLKWRNVRNSTLLVSGKTGDHIVPISATVKARLVGLGDAEHVWTGQRGPLSRSGVEQCVRAAIARAGFVTPKAGPHLLRHTFGRWYIMAGGDVFSLQRIMNHTSVRTTMIYVELSQADLETQHAQFSPLVRALERMGE